MSRGAEPAPGHASLVLALDTNALAQRADHIAVTDVVSVQSAWDQAHKKIITTIDLSVVESWKGGAQPASHITVMQPGGTVGDVAMVVFGLSHFTPGERTLVFLRGTAAAAGVVGMAQGKLPMLRDAATGKWTVGVADHAGLERVPANRNASVAPAAPTDRAHWKICAATSSRSSRPAVTLGTTRGRTGDRRRRAGVWPGRGAAAFPDDRRADGNAGAGLRAVPGRRQRHGDRRLLSLEPDLYSRGRLPQRSPERDDGDEIEQAASAAAAPGAGTSTPCTYLNIQMSASFDATRAAGSDSYNVLIFNNPWCDPGDATCQPDALAVTSVWAGKTTGTIQGADIEVNAQNFVWADLETHPAAGNQDLQNALTHEMGHLIGLDHNCYTPGSDPFRQTDNTGALVPLCPGAPADVQADTMYTKADSGDLSKRTLAPDDMQAILRHLSAGARSRFLPSHRTARFRRAPRQRLDLARRGRSSRGAAALPGGAAARARPPSPLTPAAARSRRADRAPRFRRRRWRWDVDHPFGGVVTRRAYGQGPASRDQARQHKAGAVPSHRRGDPPVGPLGLDPVRGDNRAGDLLAHLALDAARQRHLDRQRQARRKRRLRGRVSRRIVGVLDLEGDLTARQARQLKVPARVGGRAGQRRSAIAGSEATAPPPLGIGQATTRARASGRPSSSCTLPSTAASARASRTATAGGDRADTCTVSR